MESTEVRLNRTIAELEKLGVYNQFSEKRIALFKESGAPLPIKRTLQLAEDLLFEAKRTRTIQKFNGASHNEEFTESGWPEYRALSDSPQEKRVRNYMLTCNISEADARRVLGLPPAELQSLSTKQRGEYATARSCGLSEKDALRLVKKV